MELIRIIHSKHFDPRRKEFKSLAFRNSSGGGISVISKECVVAQGKHICEHINEFYADVSSVPPIFWIFSHKELPGECSFKSYPSNTGDECHGDIIGLTNNKARSIFKKLSLDTFNICIEESSYRTLKESDLLSSD